MENQAFLMLADGTVMQGTSVGANGYAVGEVVFNTSMTGYQEILTDPSYAGQLLTFTYPHIGNTGINSQDFESNNMSAKGVIVRDMAMAPSHHLQHSSLPKYLQRNGVVAISDIDTRQLTRLVAKHGSQQACIVSDSSYLDEAKAALKASHGTLGVDFTDEVTTSSMYTCAAKTKDVLGHVVVYDYGIKDHMLDILTELGCHLTVVPAKTSALDVLMLKPDGIFLSNGPGDPQACTSHIEAIQHLLTTDIPIFGICLGYQLLALALGASTSKMKFGHHGANHPVKDLRTETVAITSQNHNYHVDSTTLPSYLEITHISLFDQTLQGFRSREKKIMGFQGHPEASPGPQELITLFHTFIDFIRYSSK